MLPLVDLPHRGITPAKNIMVFALNLQNVCRERGTGIEEYIDGLVVTRGGRKFLMFSKNAETYSLSQCKLLDYDLFNPDRNFIRHVTTFDNNGIDCKTKQWRQLACDCVVVM